MGSAAATGDRLCQMEAMDGAARCLEALRLQHKICNCRPLEFNTRLLEVAGSVGAKVIYFSFCPSSCTIFLSINLDFTFAFARLSVINDIFSSCLVCYFIFP